MSNLLFEERVHGGQTWSHVLKRGTALRITDVDGGANVAAMLYNFENTAERYNMPDTLKAQHIARITSGCCLYSDMGRVLCSVTIDSLGWHDPIGGYSNAALVERKYGAGTYQALRNDFHQNARDGFLVELGKYGMTARDMTATVNFFSKVEVRDDGSMVFVEGHSPAGSFVELRAEMNTLVLLNTCPHPMDPSPKYAPKPVDLAVIRAAPPGPDDPCRRSRPENERGFILTERYFL